MMFWLSVATLLLLTPEVSSWMPPLNRAITATKLHSFSSSQDGSSSSSSKAKNDFNVVFRPSSIPEAFDSYKIGSPRVHRYAREGEGLGGSEYVMWYHARSMTANPSNQNLAPLSTGRIGVAYSRNGLHWERYETGSLSEDMAGVSLGLYTESWWGFDTAHVGLGQVLLPMATPAVISEGGKQS